MKLAADTITHGNRRHGQSRTVATGKATPTYRTWVSMLARCNNPNASNYPRYGGRGIKVCERWHTFENFLNDMGERPEGMTLDRIDSNNHYASWNCRWATPKQQAESRRPTSEWSERPGPKSKTHCKRGHELHGDNVRKTSQGTNECVACKRIHHENRKAKRGAK